MTGGRARGKETRISRASLPRICVLTRSQAMAKATGKSEQDAEGRRLEGEPEGLEFSGGEHWGFSCW